MQDQALTHAAELFAEGDANNDGYLTCHEMLRLLKKVKLLRLALQPCMM